MFIDKRYECDLCLEIHTKSIPTYQDRVSLLIFRKSQCLQNSTCCDTTAQALSLTAVQGKYIHLRSSFDRHRQGFSDRLA